jgi:acetyl esterase/lipase
MVDRFLLWLRVGVVTAGMSAAMLAGAGLAVADDASPSDAGGPASSESSNSTDSKDDSDKDPPGDDQPSANDPEPGDDDDADPGPGTEGPSTEPGEEGTEEEPTESPSTETPEETTEPEPAADDTTSESDTAETQQPVTAKAKPADTLDKPAVEEPEPTAKEAVEVEPAETIADPPAATVEPVVVVVEDAAVDTTATAMAFAAPTTSDELAPTATAQTTPTLLSVIGTVIFNLYAFATRLIGGPAVVPPGSSVTVRQSTLHIDCGEGYDVPADWYIPAAGPEPPTRLIYLQHGFLAQGPWYSYTAATLAEQTNSIVVAPSITSNFLACDACWLGAPPMHEAVANLFKNGDTALADSLRATGYEGALPQRVVLVGHSLGGGLVAGTSGHMVENGTIGKLAGVVMLDGVGLDGSMTASLKLVPDEIPIYQLAAPSYFWNQNGVGSTALQQARPDTFIGVVLEGGSHVDAMQGGNPLIQFAQELVAGFTEARNVEAAKILMVGWINDMFDPTGEPEGIYGDPREVITIDTPAGVATAIALPSSLTKWHLFNLLQPFVPLGNAFFSFEPTCVTDTMTSSGCQGSLAA